MFTGAHQGALRAAEQGQRRPARSYAHVCNVTAARGRGAALRCAVGLAAAVTRQRPHRVLIAAATGALHRYLARHEGGCKTARLEASPRMLCCVPALLLVSAHSPCASTASTSPDCARQCVSCWQPTLSSNQSVRHTCHELAPVGRLCVPSTNSSRGPCDVPLWLCQWALWKPTTRS